MLSDALKEYHAGEEGVEISQEILKVLAYGSVSPSHAGMFVAYSRTLHNKDILNAIIKGDARWPGRPEERDVLYFLAQSFRATVPYPQGKGADQGTQQHQL